MEVILSEYLGFCYGVKRAIKIAREHADGKSCTLGPIIHNPQMVERLKVEGVGSVEDLTAMEEGTIIIRSHGVGPQVYKQAQAKGLHVVDATCPHVKKAQLSAKELAEDGRQVVIVGEKNHPEVKSIFEWSNKAATILESEDDAKNFAPCPKLGIVSQTTVSGENFVKIVAHLLGKSHDIRILRTICTATDQRQTAALNLAGKVDVMSTYDCVGDYLMANNDEFEKVNDDWIKGLADNFCFAVRDEDTEIKAALDKAIDEMKSDGTLDKLINEYINVRDKEKTPPKVEIPHFEGADTIKVGVTGDLPPLDLILPDNSPAGFNTALLAEIAKRSGVNIEPVQIDSGARAAALAEGHIDVVFWAIVPVGEFLPADIDQPAGVELSAPYFHDEIIHLKLKS